ncbi:MAG: HD domain-containing protein [Lachnospiraceae bacterium]|nr:HD domain-containing protein [Lachnospiraceae bacterium]
MKTITRMECKPGMVLAEPVEHDGEVLFKAGRKIDERVMERLERFNILCVTIMEDVDYATTHYQKIQYSTDFQNFVKVYQEQLLVYKAIMISYLGTKSMDPASLMAVYNKINEYVSSEKQLLDFIYNMMPGEDELTYTASLNSALLCGAFANWMGMDAHEKKRLIMCGFFYDIGKWKLPNEILWKPGKLTDEEFEMVRKHPVIGYVLVRNDPNLSDHIKAAILMHHERMDGSGYPSHLTGDKIDKYARYMAIVDTYIAMASPRMHRRAFTPLQIIGTLEKSKEKYDNSILMPLIERISEAQIGTKVELNDGSVWEVMIITKQPYSRPILRDENGEILNLAEHPELEIEKLA